MGVVGCTPGGIVGCVPGVLGIPGRVPGIPG